MVLKIKSLNQTTKKNMESDDLCGECGKPFNGEYHGSDECITPTNEDRPEPQDLNSEYEKIKNL